MTEHTTLDELVRLWTDAYRVRAKNRPTEALSVPVRLMSEMLDEIRQRRAEDELYGQQMADRNRDVEIAGAELRRAKTELDAGKAELARARETINTVVRLKLDAQAERDLLIMAARDVVVAFRAPHDPGAVGFAMALIRPVETLNSLLPPQEPEKRCGTCEFWRGSVNKVGDVAEPACRWLEDRGDKLAKLPFWVGTWSMGTAPEGGKDCPCWKARP